jgi:hypothetical protein
MTYCVIIHNMIIEDEWDLDLECFYNNVGSRVKPKRNPDRLQALLDSSKEIEHEATHDQLQQDLIDHN